MSRFGPAQHELGPAPNGGAISFQVRCGPLSDQADAPLHMVTIHQDWSISTVYDIDAECVAAGLGGSSTCWEFASKDVSAYRFALELLSGKLGIETFRSADDLSVFQSSGAAGCSCSRDGRYANVHSLVRRAPT